MSRTEDNHPFKEEPVGRRGQAASANGMEWSRQLHHGVDR